MSIPHPILLDGRLYETREPASPGCSCRRCAPWKEDFGGCIVAAAMWNLVTALMGR